MPWQGCFSFSSLFLPLLQIDKLLPPFPFCPLCANGNTNQLPNQQFNAQGQVLFVCSVLARFVCADFGCVPVKWCLGSSCQIRKSDGLLRPRSRVQFLECELNRSTTKAAATFGRFRPPGASCLLGHSALTRGTRAQVPNFASSSSGEIPPLGLEPRSLG